MMFTTTLDLTRSGIFKFWLHDVPRCTRSIPGARVTVPLGRTTLITNDTIPMLHKMMDITDSHFKLQRSQHTHQDTLVSSGLSSHHYTPRKPPSGEQSCGTFSPIVLAFPRSRYRSSACYQHFPIFALWLPVAVIRAMESGAENRWYRSRWCIW
jgi:hypothetical protein